MIQPLWYLNVKTSCEEFFIDLNGQDLIFQISSEAYFFITQSNIYDGAFLQK